MIQRKVEVAAGWIVFSIALFVYFDTLEPTVSFWDCGEFIACSAKLEIGHQPGAPFFLLLGRIFSVAAGNNSSHIALMINALSAIASAFTIFFLYKTILLLFERITPNGCRNIHNRILYISGAAAGSLLCTFSDTFWFSAVEGEVYALSSFFTAIVFWCMLRWAKEVTMETGNSKADRWLILIAYLTGLSIGVHLLNLLSIPALVAIYYFTKKKPTVKGFLIALLFSFALLGTTVFILIPWIIRLAAWTDLLFVNGFGLPLNSGALFYILLLFSLVLYLLIYSHRKQKVILNKIIISIAVFLVGYSCYMILPLRAASNPPINLNKVNNPFNLLQYVNREQYVSRPLIYGPNFNARAEGYKEKFSWVPQDGKYVKRQVNGKLVYDKNELTLFPRMSSTEPRDIEGYKKWTGIRGNYPKFRDNIRFFLTYQVGYMYWRYFMWNFAGRQNDMQGTGDILNGNWISGIPIMDQLRLGPQDNIPEYLLKNKGRNKYYLLPLILGLAGLIYHYRNARKDFIVVLLLFLLTGLAIVIYLNEIPVTPRERDYAVGGSFYVFCIWAAFGTIAFARWLGKIIPARISIIISSVIALSVPAWVASENYDDHDRSGRHFARAVAINYLNSCEKNAILFTNADNDTYPLWYAQEVEGIRTDVRVVLTPFLTADWYIEKLAEWQNEAAPAKMNIDFTKYASGDLNYVPFYKRTDNAAPLVQVLEFVGSNNPLAMLNTVNDSPVNYYPTNKMQLYNNINEVKPVQFSVSDRALQKHIIAALDIIAANYRERPVYFLSPQVPMELGLTDYVRQDGFAYRLVPEKFKATGSLNIGSIQTDTLYEKLMDIFEWGNMNDPDVYFDNNCVLTTSVLGIRNVFARLSEKLLQEGRNEKAIEVLDRCMYLMPHDVVPYDFFILRIIEAYANAGATEKALHIFKDYREILEQDMAFYRSLNKKFLNNMNQQISETQFIIGKMDELEKAIGQKPV